MNIKFTVVSLILLGSISAVAQVDTITTATKKLVTTGITSGKKSYAVFFTDSLDHRTSTADIWDRDVKLVTNAKGEQQYDFRWHWYRADTLLMEADAICQFPALKPISYTIIRPKAKPIEIKFEKDEVFVKSVHPKSRKDTSFIVKPGIPAFAFPMDMEIFSLLPIKKIGQRFMIPFYEPGRTTAAWYPVTVTAHEDLPLTGHISVPCWVIRIDYTGSTSSATFWINDKDRDLLKMKSCFKGRCRYKVKLY
jgi:hypothetical protein